METIFELLYDNDLLRRELLDNFIPEAFDRKTAALLKQSGRSISAPRIKELRFRSGDRLRQHLPGDMKGWFPKKISWQQHRPMLEWIYFGRSDFSAPFYDQMLLRHGQNPINQLLGFTSPLDLVPKPEGPAPVPLSGLIFHISRCGSTLVSQMLSAVNGHRVISEPGPVDAVLRGRFRDPSVGDDLRAQWLKRLVNIFGQRLTPRDRRLFIKLDAWHMMALPLIHRTFPGVPILFLYRHPLEVLVSHERKPGRHTVPGEIPVEWFGGTKMQLKDMGLDTYPVWVLESMLNTACDHAESIRFSSMDYAQLPESLWAIDNNPFGLNFSDGEIQSMKAASGYYSKDPGRRFRNDTREKQKSAGVKLRGLVKKMMLPTWEKWLESHGNRIRQP
ncbi:MAG TPA: hypothetical protein DHV36_04765 [Desulfobacteraceae bacterium]|nr:hypothetical protein [Desulfobacteraceae bacterium]